MRFTRSCLLGLTLVLCAASARAQGSADFAQIQDVARAKAEEGLALFGQGNWTDAFERFRVAEDLFHAPTLVLHMAHCKVELGQLLEARSLYRRVASEVLAADAPPAFAAAIDEARARLERLATRIPTAAFAVRGGGTGTRLLLDGKPAPLSPDRVELDPGTHRIDATSEGARPLETTFQIAEGEAKTIDVPLERLPAPKPPPAPPSRSAPRGSVVPALVAFGIGAVGLGVGAATGAVVLGKVSDLRDRCGGTVCPKKLEDERNSTRPLATVSTVGFVVGGVGVATGAVLVVLRPGGGAPATTAAVGAGMGSARLTLTGAF